MKAAIISFIFLVFIVERIGNIDGEIVVLDFWMSQILQQTPAGDVSPAEFLYVFPKKYTSIILKINMDTNIPLVLLIRLIERESNWNERLVYLNQNGTSDYGLMQLNSRYLDEYARRYYDGCVLDPFDPAANLEVGMRYLRHLYETTGNWFGAVCAYNAGLSRVRAGTISRTTLEYAEWIIGQLCKEIGEKRKKVQKFTLEKL